MTATIKSSAEMEYWFTSTSFEYINYSKSLCLGRSWKWH